jgi:hypothetical protein
MVGACKKTRRQCSAEENEKKGHLYSKRRKGRPRMRWLEEVESDLKRMKVKGWREKMRDRERWRLPVEEAKAHQGL